MKSEPTFTIYVIDLKKNVLLNRAFLAANPDYVRGKPCVYVGLTAHTAEKRFTQHIDGVRFRYSRIARVLDCRYAFRTAV